MKTKLLHGGLSLMLVFMLFIAMAFTTKSSDCVTMSFAAYEDGICIATIDLFSNCTFHYVNKEEAPVIEFRGTYEMEDGSIEKGCQKRITIYSDEGSDRGFLVWPLQQDIRLILGEFDFEIVR